MARIVAFANVFDALTSDRPNKKAWAIEEAVLEIENCAGTHFDPDLIEPFKTALPQILKIMEQYSDKHGAKDDLAFIKSGG